jgi:hypothetical protein
VSEVTLEEKPNCTKTLLFPLTWQVCGRQGKRFLELRRFLPPLLGFSLFVNLKFRVTKLFFSSALTPRQSKLEYLSSGPAL